jgi:hypothetical protein
MKVLFISEKNLIDKGLSEQEFENNSTLTPEQIAKLNGGTLESGSIVGNGFTVSEPITVCIDPNKHGITLMQNFMQN